MKRNRQPEFFFNGIVGHIRADRHGWINSWEQSTQLANYWRRHFNIPEVHHEHDSWQHHPQTSDNADQLDESQESIPGSGMDDTDSIAANVCTASVPSQIHQLAAVLWDILNNDRDSNAAILEKLENPGDDLRGPSFFNLASLFFNLTSFFNLGKLFFLTLPRYLSFLTLPPLFF